MPDTEEIVINTSPMIALVAALGALELLQMYRRVLVPFVDTRNAIGRVGKVWVVPL
jgi:hypothetical protein